MPEIPIKEALNKAYIKVRPERAAIERFKSNFMALIDGIRDNPTESEEFLKNLFSDFLKNTWYSPGYFINTHQRVDLVIHTGPDTSSPVGVIIETKKPANKNEMVSQKNLNVKAMQELLLYYLRETIDNDNLNLKYLIITNTVEWFIFDARDFYHCFSQNKELIKLYSDFKTGSLLEKDNTFFYSQIAAPYIKANEKDLNYTYFNITEYEKIIRNQEKKEEDNKLIRLYKLLSPSHLLKLPFANDSNTLNQNFYFELLYLIGLTEDKEEGKKVIVRNQKTKRQAASLIENTIFQLSDDIADEEILFDIALELNITWIDRILFLKLLEAQQLQYQDGNLDYAFLNIKTIKTFNDLNTLFFKVLAVLPQKREEKVKDKYKYVPYLNSSLFEKTENERDYTPISNLQNEEIDVFSSTVLKDETGNKRRGKINILEYIFKFLDAYDFSSEGSEEIQEQNKTLINASVLGLIFEKINGYKDGSYFTPGFITSFICSETIKNVVIDKFNAIKGWKAKTLNDIYNKINTNDIAEANKIINSITILDPAVGSGHFLVSALNEIIAVKSELGILVDNEGRRIKDYFIKVYNDELLIYDENNNFFEYNYKNREKQRIQETIFQEKRRIIENSLFGVDLNRNSVKICRLRLWIELLKNAYYTKESEYTELETLPNLDINIKPGNSLISRFDLDIDLKNNLSGLKYTVKDYREAVYNYKNSTNKDDNKKLLHIISEIKNDFAENSKKQNVLFTEKANLEKRLAALGADNMELDFVTEKQLEDKQKKIQKIQGAILKKETEISNFMNGVVYDDAFEWRFEFPEVLDPDSNFIGFDAVIGNPPYGILNKKQNKSESIVVPDEELDYYKDNKLYVPAQGGMLNIFRLFIVRSLSLLKPEGVFTQIFPLAFTGDISIKNLRKHVFDNMQINFIEAFPERDDMNKRVFEAVKMSVCILSCKKISPVSTEQFYLRMNYDRQIAPDEKKNYLTRDDIQFLQPQYLSIPLTSPIETKLLLKTFKKGIRFNELGSCGEGEVHMTFCKSAFTNDKNKAVLLKGAIIDRYLLRTRMSQGEIVFIDEDILRSLKTIDMNTVNGERIVMQGITGVNEKIRLKAMIVSGVYCANSLNFLTLNKPVNKKYLLGILNSKLLNFIFAKFSTNSNVNGYEVNNLPIVQADKEAQMKIVSLVDKILTAKTKNPSISTEVFEREIDDIVYSLYQLTPEEIEIVNRSR
jgi:Alw26I/Eco31I/Esp3I family type II restriction m6 adenine DNA methyltransferase